jgi:RimJ/RimL family protein N-acetyltransferase
VTHDHSSARIEPWDDGDLPLLERLLGDPAMMAHLGGPESRERIARRQADYQQPGSRQYRIVDPKTGEGAGWVGYWHREWRGSEVFEIGWAVAPEFQGRGLAGAGAALAIELARAEREPRFMHAYPSVENAPSNAICRKLGFRLSGPVDAEYPPGTAMRCNDWRLDLRTEDKTKLGS